MAIIHGGLHRIAVRYPNINLENIKIVAWGAGQFFRDLYTSTGINAEYTICPYEANHGKIIHGLEVKSPNFLKNEDPEKVFILIFSASSIEITHQIASLGKFRSAPAIEYGSSHNHLIEEILLLQKNINSIPPKKEHFSEIGFFTQGPIFPFTELALAHHRFNFPNDYHCFATDAGQSPEELEKCARWVDEIIEVPPPENPGHLRRNYMIRTARAGAEKIKNKGLKYAVRVRSGNITIGNIRKYIYQNFGSNGEYNEGKFGFYMGWSWKNVPFHISEAFMISKSEDMVNLWSINEDSRYDSDPIFHISAEDHHLDLARVTNENYVWTSFAKKLGMPASTIVDHLQFIKEKLIPLEPDLSTYSLKYIPIFSLDFNNGLSPNNKWWSELIRNPDYIRHKSLEISQFNFSVADHFSNKIG